MPERSAALVAVIPARIGSTRFPEKPLARIAGVPMITRVVERVRASGAFDHILVATDEERIANAARNAGADARMTDSYLANGTLRCHAALCQWEAEVGYEATWVVNVQGDEPLIPPEVINQVAGNLEQSATAGVATLCEPFDSVIDFVNPNAVKVVSGASGNAHYFSRAPIPFPRDKSLGSDNSLPDEARRHIGIYAYKVASLNQFIDWDIAPLEQLESLEQLRFLANGIDIHVADACVSVPGGVDTEEDLESIINSI